MTTDELDESHHAFLMDAAFSHEGEGTATAAPVNVKKVMEKANAVFPGVIAAHNLVRATEKVLSDSGFEASKTLLATSFCCDEVNRNLEDELREKFGANFHLGGIAGFPFGGVTAFGAFLHHIPPSGRCLIIYGPHVGIDWDGVVGKVNRKGHEGSGACCNTAIGAMAFVQAVQSGQKIASPDPSDPIDAQQVFVDNALLPHGDRLSKAELPHAELPLALLDCQKELIQRIINKCVSDIPEGMVVAVMGGIHVNTPEGTPEYFLPKSFDLWDSTGAVVEDVLGKLVEESVAGSKETVLAKLAARKAKKEAEEKAKEQVELGTKKSIYG